MSEWTTDLPVVDLDDDPNSPELRRGLFETGFFLLQDHVIPRPLLDGVRAKTLEFMAKPNEEKQALRGSLRGWTPLGAESATAGYGDGKAGEMDACQKYSMGPIISRVMRDANPDYYDDPVAARYFEENVFPNAGMQSLWEEYYRAMKALCHRLLDAIKETLGLPKSAWLEQIDKPVSVMRFLEYPAVSQNIRMGAHFDDTLVTVLHQNVPESGFAGLQVQLPGENEWRSVPPSDDVFVVNTGETLTYLSDGVVRATKHRVVAPPAEQVAGSARTSLCYFHLPNWNARLVPATVEGMDASVGKQSTSFHLEELLEPDGSVMFYKAQARSLGKLTGSS